MHNLTSVWRKQRDAFLALAIFLGAWGLYALTAAPGTVFGDPSEYQFIPGIWGIAHPPGYAFYTLLAGMWQRLLPLGSVAWRTNLLAGAAGAWIASRVFLIVLDIWRGSERRFAVGRGVATFSALFAALALVVATDVWLHSIHANAHILSAAITVTQLWLLVRWQRTQQDGWLLALAFLCGIGVTHHPITVFGLPAYAIFIVINRPKFLIQPKILLPFVLCGFLGLLPWLYFPLRSPHVLFGPTDMATWDGFLRHATAQGLRVNLFHFGWADQFNRLRVFWSLLRLQYVEPLLLIMALGALVLLRRRPRVAGLLGLFLLGHLGFTLNSVQDVMAYLLHPFVALAIFLGVGSLYAFEALAKLPTKIGGHNVPRLYQKMALATLALIFPFTTLLHTFPRISMREWRDADDFVADLHARFGDAEQGAFLSSDWEHLTPYFYHSYVEGAEINAADLQPVYIAGSLSWLDSVFANLPQGPVYLTNYRRDIREIGFRLRPEGNLWRVLEPPALAPVTPQVRLADKWVAGQLEILGYDLSATSAVQGDVLSLDLYARAPLTPSAILMPFVTLGGIEQRWATDSRRLTPDWQPGEIIVERYEILVPYTLTPGSHSLYLGYTDVTGGDLLDVEFSNAEPRLSLGELQVAAYPFAARAAKVLQRALVNIGNDIALMSAQVRSGLTVARRGIWDEPLAVKAGQTLQLDLVWRALDRPRSSYTVFIHLIDAGGAPVMGHDDTPLGGAFPTYLWFPKWIEGQQVTDPYRLQVPEDVAPGQYWLEVGMYEMGSVRRISQVNSEGTMIGDRLVLGSVIVMP